MYVYVHLYMCTHLLERLAQVLHLEARSDGQLPHLFVCWDVYVVVYMSKGVHTHPSHTHTYIHMYLVTANERCQPREALLARATHADEEGVPARVGEDAADAGHVLHGLFRCI